MKFIKPNFYDAFHCTAAACSDTCCAGWEIDVDPDTVEYYENLEGELGDRLREELCDLPDGTVCFRLGENERCPFLDDDNLCELILKLGDDALCEICVNTHVFMRSSAAAWKWAWAFAVKRRADCCLSRKIPSRSSQRMSASCRMRRRIRLCSICGTKHLPSCRTALCRCACACTACSISACRRRNAVRQYVACRTREDR